MAGVLGIAPGFHAQQPLGDGGQVCAGGAGGVAGLGLLQQRSHVAWWCRVGQLQPGLAQALTGTVQFVVKSPDAAFAVDGSGTVTEGKVERAQTTLTLSDDDFAALCEGQTDIRSLYQHGKLRIDGLVTPAHHLDFLRS